MILAAVSRLNASGMNNYVWLADAWLHGHVWIANAGPYIDWVSYKGHPYVIEGPLPAIVMLPFVAMFGMQTNQTVLGIVAAGVGISALWRLCQQNQVSLRDSILIAAFFMFGTSYFVCAVIGDVWYVAHIFAALFTLLALTEIFGKRRVAVVTFWGVCAALCRFPLIVAVPLYIAFCSGGNWRAAFSSLWVLLPTLATWVWYNEARWGQWNDIGYSYWYYAKDPRAASGSPPFSIAHLPMQLHAFFDGGLLVKRSSPWIFPSAFGTAITITSPPLLLSLFAAIKNAEAQLLWLLAVSTSIPSFLYYDTGGAQFGMRHALDFAPFLVALVILVAKNKALPAWSFALFAWSVLFGIYGGLIFIFDRAATTV